MGLNIKQRLATYFATERFTSVEHISGLMHLWGDEIAQMCVIEAARADAALSWQLRLDEAGFIDTLIRHYWMGYAATYTAMGRICCLKIGLERACSSAAITATFSHLAAQAPAEVPGWNDTGEEQDQPPLPELVAGMLSDYGPYKPASVDSILEDLLDYFAGLRADRKMSAKGLAGSCATVVHEKLDTFAQRLEIHTNDEELQGKFRKMAVTVAAVADKAGHGQADPL